MNNTDWLRFTWKLGDLGPPARSPEKYRIRTAEADEMDPVATVLKVAVILDNEWSAQARQIGDFLEERLEKAFPKKEKSNVLVLCHGTRIIGASLLDPSPAAEFQVVSGPSVLMEYRRRGFGTLLLQASLLQLRKSGLDVAHGITRKGSMAADHVYTKFGGTGGPFPFAFSETGV